MNFNFYNKKIAIVGFGKEGKSTLKFLLKSGVKSKNIFIFDKNISKIENKNIKLFLGKNYLKNLDDSFSYIFKSPGISIYQNIELQKYTDKITSQSDYFFSNYKGKIISITQTKGKSTTATLVYNLLKNAKKKVKFVGNIGSPIFDEIDFSNTLNDYIVIELSSYMLDGLKNHKSFISIFGNIFPDHLDWHGTFKNYQEAKLNILNNSKNILIGKDVSKKFEKNLFDTNYYIFGGKKSNYSHIFNNYYINGKNIDKKIIPLIPGKHNQNNFCAILGVCDILKIDLEIFEKTINDFQGLPHRLQNIGTYSGITFIDDAISTTPESTIEAIKSFKNIDTILLGGTDRGYNFKKLVKLIEQGNISNIVFFPESGKRIKKEFIKKIMFLETDSMKEAVGFAFKNTKKGKICLLSTASPSYFLWKNFEEKGKLFKKEIKIFNNKHK